MKIQLSLMLALGCVGAFASSATNYDILGRKGSKMNSPMVYKSVDYSKVKKNEPQKIGSSLESRALHRTGMTDDVAAIEGSYRSYVNNNHFYLKRHYYANPDNCNNSLCLYNWDGYRNAVNRVFIKVNEDPYVNPNYEVFEGLSHSETSGAYTLTRDNYWPYGFSGPYGAPSPFEDGQYIQSPVLWYVRDIALRRRYLQNDYLNKASYVGIYMGANALPVPINGVEPPPHYMGYVTYPVKYVRMNENETFMSSPGYEMRDSWTYFLLMDNSPKNVVYVDKAIDYGNPAAQTPQIYIGVRNYGMAKGSSNSYSSNAKALDNFIYKYRTIEFAPAGNYGIDGTSSQGNISMMGQAANAITVGSVEPINLQITNYTSTKNYNGGSVKPEIYNLTNLTIGGYRRTYSQIATGREYVYYPFFYGTESSAAFTAGMVAYLLEVNPFYRWHPEVVKAMLLTSEGWAINPPYPSNSVMESVPSFTYLVFDDVGSKPNFDYDSRYWNGSIEKLKTRTNANDQKEIWFVTKNLGSSTKPASAAISWLSSGNDISYIGRIPQDFDLTVYGSNNSNYEKYTKQGANLNGFNFDNPGDYIDGSNRSNNSFEKVSISTNHKYLVFKILLYSEDERSENKGQVVMGFNMASADKGVYQ